MNNQIGLKQGFEERLDIVAENILRVGAEVSNLQPV